MKRTILAAIVALGTSLATFAAPQYRATITAAGYSGSTTLTNFPVLVRISPSAISGFSYANCAADGADIRFVAADGETDLAREIDTWNTNGESFVWVKLPTLANGSSFKMTWSDAAIAAQPASQTDGSVWTDAAYKSVWHMNVNGSSTADSVAGYAGTLLNKNDYCGAGTGIVGGSYHNEQNTSCHGVKTTSVAGFTSDATSVATYSAWVCQIGGTAANASPNPVDYPQIKWSSQWGNCGALWNSKNGGTEESSGIEFCLEGKADQLNTMVVRDKTTTTTTLGVNTIYDAQWHHLVLTYDGTTRRLYLDGVVQPNFTVNGTVDNPTGTVRMGARSDSLKDCVWTGDLDEMRFRAACSSEDWITAEYANVSGGSFLTYGDAAYAVEGASLVVAGLPEEIGTPSPNYGITVLNAGDALDCSASATASEGTATNVVTGWTLESINPADDTRTPVRDSATSPLAGESATLCKYVQGSSPAVLTWLWEKRDVLGLGNITAMTNQGNFVTLAIDVTGLGYEAASSATLTLQYGLSASALTESITLSAPVTAPGMVAVTVDRLNPATTYFFKASLAAAGSGATAESSVTAITTASFTTGRRRVEYIEGDGRQCVDTLYLTTPATRAVFDYQILDVVSQYRIFGKEFGDLYYNAYVSSALLWSYCLNDTGLWKVVGEGTTADTERHLFDFNYIDGDGNHAYTIYGTNGNVVATQSPLEGSPTRNATATLILGGNRKGSATDLRCITPHRIYSGYLYESNALTRTFLPVVTDNGLVALYDSVAGILYPSAGSADYSVYGPAIVTEEKITGGNHTIALSFLAAPMARSLCIAYGPTFAGDDPAAWATTNFVASIPAGATSFDVPIPVNWGDDNTLVARCYFDDGTSFPLWSDAVVWQDASAPILTGVTADGTGGDTITVSGSLVSFDGEECTLTVLSGPSASNLSVVWSGLAGSVRSEPGAFSFTLFEGDTASPNYIQPGSTYYVAVRAVAGETVSSSSAVVVQAKGEAIFSESSLGAAVNNRQVTFTGALEDVGSLESATVTLYVGTSNNDDSLVAVESPIVVTNQEAFSITHTFPALESTYYWQFRAVNQTAGGTTTCAGRSARKSCKTTDALTYTWQPVDGDWNGSWSDPAHWSTSDAENTRYPCVGTCVVNFTNCTKDHPVVVTVDGKYTVKTFNFWGAAAADLTFVGNGTETSAITAGTTEKSGITSDTTVEFRNMTLTRTGNWELLRDNGNTTNVTFRLSGVSSTGSYLSLAAAGSTMEFHNSTVSATKINIAGTNSVVVVDNSSLNVTGTGFIHNADIKPGPGDVEIRICGKNPKIQTVTFGPWPAHAKDSKTFVRLNVPIGGYTEAPIQVSYPFGQAGSGTTQAKIFFVVDEDSPALCEKHDLLEKMVIVQQTAPKAIDTTIVAEGIGTVPTHHGILAGSFMYGINGVALGDGDDITTAKQILLDLQGWHVPGTFLILR